MREAEEDHHEKVEGNGVNEEGDEGGRTEAMADGRDIDDVVILESGVTGVYEVRNR